MPRRLRALPVVAGCLGLALTLAGCTADEPTEPGAGGPVATTDGPTDGPTDGAQPGERAEAYEVPAGATPVPLEDLGTLQTDVWTMTLNGLRRTGDDAVMLTATMESGSAVSFSVFEEQGYVFRDGDDGPFRTFEFSAVTLQVPGDPAVYRVMRDEEGVCACYEGVQGVPEGPFAVHALLTAPAGASTVDVTVAGLGTLTGVPVSAS